MKRRLSVTNMSSENNLPTFQLNAPVIIGSELKLVTDNLLFISAIFTQNSDVMRHVTKYCNVIVLYCTVQCGGTRLVYAVHQTLPSFAEVGRACETNMNHGIMVQFGMVPYLCVM